MSDGCQSCGCGSNGDPDKTPRESVLNPGVAASAQTTLKVAGMDCADVVAAIERVLKPISGIRETKDGPAAWFAAEPLRETTLNA